MVAYYGVTSFFLFCLSLIPFGTAWMGEHHFVERTTLFYGILLIMVAIAYANLSYRIKKNKKEKGLNSH